MISHQIRLVDAGASILSLKIKSGLFGLLVSVFFRISENDFYSFFDVYYVRARLRSAI